MPEPMNPINRPVGHSFSSLVPTGGHSNLRAGVQPMGAEKRMSDKLDGMYRRSLDDPRGFWAEAAQDIVWTRRWDEVLDDSNRPFYRWFSGGELNTCYNALDHQIENGRADQLALIYDSPVTDSLQRCT